MTDNGSAYRAHAFRDMLKAESLRHVRTRPYTPRTDGKAERFIQTSLRAWVHANAYATSAGPTEAMSGFLTRYRTARPQTALERQTPWARLNNLLGNDAVDDVGIDGAGQEAVAGGAVAGMTPPPARRPELICGRSHESPRDNGSCAITSVGRCGHRLPHDRDQDFKCLAAIAPFNP